MPKNKRLIWYAKKYMMCLDMFSKILPNKTFTTGLIISCYSGTLNRVNVDLLHCIEVITCYLVWGKICKTRQDIKSIDNVCDTPQMQTHMHSKFGIQSIRICWNLTFCMNLLERQISIYYLECKEEWLSLKQPDKNLQTLL